MSDYLLFEHLRKETGPIWRGYAVLFSAIAGIFMRAVERRKYFRSVIFIIWFLYYFFLMRCIRINKRNCFTLYNMAEVQVQAL